MESPQIESKVESTNVLVIRPDRLGDVILSTPVFEVIKKNLANTHLTVLVRKEVMPILKDLPWIDGFISFDLTGRHAGIRGFFRLYSEIKRHQFKIAVVLQSHWKIAAAIFLARIRYRVGPLSKFYSYLFFNRGMRQRRSHVEMHETDYNLQLLKKLGIQVGTREVNTQVSIPEATQSLVRGWLLQQGWDPQRPLILVHPGMGGSALNWPENQYHELIRALIAEGKQVLVTGGPTEGELLERVQNALGPYKDKVLYFLGSQDGSIDYFAGLCSLCQLVVAPSTGPLHLAVAVGKPVVTFYPPIRVQSALRWGPYLSDEARASVLVPEVYCGQDFKCLGNLCNYFPCMKTITVKQTLAQVNRQLESYKNAQKIPTE